MKLRKHNTALSWNMICAMEKTKLAWCQHIDTKCYSAVNTPTVYETVFPSASPESLRGGGGAYAKEWDE